MPSHADLFRAWCALRGNPEAVLAAFNLSPEELLDFTHAYAQRIAQWRTLIREHASLASLDHQHAAAAKLRDTLASDNPIEARRAASALARVAAEMARLHGTRPARPSQTPAPSDPPEDAPPPEPPTADDDPNPARVLTGAVYRIALGDEFAADAAAAHLAVQLAPNATIDGAPLPAGARSDPRALSKFVASSPLARLIGCTRRRQWQSGENGCLAHVAVEYESRSTPAFLLAARLTRPHDFAPWMIEAFTFPKDPPTS